MGQDKVEILFNIIKLVVIFLMMIQLVPLLVWIERRGSAFIQHRYGPNRVGPLGLLQLLADAVKFVMKEEFVPKQGIKFLFYLAPILALIPGALAMLAIPFSSPIFIESIDMFGQTWGPYTIKMQGADIPLGIIYIFGVSSLGAYPLLLAGWGSANKYSMMGALRASAQMISYELALGISVLGVLLLYGSFDLNQITAMQQGPLSFYFLGKEYILSFLPNWGIFFQPIGFLIFLSAGFAETNRLPFDLPEAEGELVAGFHTEYSGFKMLMFYIGEYGHMMVSGALCTIFFFGGYNLPFISQSDLADILKQFASGPTQLSIYLTLINLVSFSVKVFLFLWVYVWVRWTLPRFRYDQLMDLGWKTMLPWAIANTIITAVFVFLGHYK